MRAVRKKSWLRVAFAIGLSLGFGGCAWVTEDPWSWLDKSEEQVWVETVVNLPGREVRFSVPDRLRAGGSHVRRAPPPDRETGEHIVTMPPEAFNTIRWWGLRFVWEWYWGGFYKKGDHDFSLSVRVWSDQSDVDLLDLSPPKRIEHVLDYYRERYAGGDPFWGKFFFEHHWIKSFENRQGHIWVVQNQPVVTLEHIKFQIPIADRRVLEFSFFIAKDRFGGPDDPAWMERRRQIAYKIMDTVRIDPDPFPE